LTYVSKTRVSARARSCALLSACAVGLASGGAYLAVDQARASVRPIKAPESARAAKAVASAPVPAQLAADAPSALKAGLRLTSDPTPAQPFQLRGALQNSSRDLDCLTAAVYYEARGETAAGQAAVAQVVLNRVRHPAFPKTVCGVVYQGVHTGNGCQFSFACSGAIGRPHEQAAWRRSQEVAIHALEGGVMSAVGDATHFHAARAGASFGRGMTRVAQVGLQVFYKFSGYEGSPGRYYAEPRRSPENAEPQQVEARANGQYLMASAPTQQATVAAPAKDTAPAAAKTPAAKPHGAAGA
jgi:spore germination cell wall hydrolase CwlJ-like protein